MDPLGGSWYVESMTNNMENGAMKYFKEIEENGGVIECIENGYFQREIANASSDYNDKLENGNRFVVGMNKFVKSEEDIKIPILKISKRVENNQIKRIDILKSKRDNSKVFKVLSDIKRAAKSSDNLVPHIINAALAYATLGEIVDAMKECYGEWHEKSII